MTTRPVLSDGVYWVSAVCPRCRVATDIAISLATVLTVPADDVGSLKIRARCKPVDHQCHQTAIRFEPSTGEVVDV